MCPLQDANRNVEDKKSTTTTREGLTYHHCGGGHALHHLEETHGGEAQRRNVKETYIPCDGGIFVGRYLLNEKLSILNSYLSNYI